MYNNLLVIALSLMIGFMLISGFLDVIKKRKIKFYPSISFVIPAYNVEHSIKECIESVYSSYDNSKMELVVVNDASKDNTLKILQNMQKKYKFKLLNNEENKGKSYSVNRAFESTKNKIIIFMDADMVLNKKSITDCITRLESNPKTAAVSCRCKIRNMSWFTILQEFEYNMLGLFLISFNHTTAISLNGGCIVVKREAFLAVGKFTRSFTAEDIELAMKLNKNGWQVQQSPYPVLTYAPRNLREWVDQKIRWSSGVVQSILRHYKTYLSNPTSIAYILLYGFIFYASIHTANSLGPGTIMQKLGSKLLYSLFSLPYILLSTTSFKNAYRVLLVFPYALVYLPVRSVVAIVGYIKGIYKAVKLKDTDRGW
jgi:cellulose synthase/poly-beta-1,6-N-acetylglucosamine synthase-like glycosyltransferase